MTPPAGPAVGSAARSDVAAPPAEPAVETGGRDVWGYNIIPLPAGPLAAGSAARSDKAPPSTEPVAKRDVTVVRGRDGGGSSAGFDGRREGAGGAGRDAIVGERPPSGGHVSQRASVDGCFKPYVSAQRGSHKH